VTPETFNDDMHVVALFNLVVPDTFNVLLIIKLVAFIIGTVNVPPIFAPPYKYEKPVIFNVSLQYILFVSIELPQVK
jgi:hypothetical protein